MRGDSGACRRARRWWVAGGRRWRWTREDGEGCVRATTMWRVAAGQDGSGGMGRAVAIVMWGILGKSFVGKPIQLSGHA